MDIWNFWLIISKLILYIGILFAVGTVFYQLIFETATTAKLFNTHRTIIAFAGAGFAAAMMSYLLRAAALTGEASAMINLEMLLIIGQTPIATALILRMVGLGLILLTVSLSLFRETPLNQFGVFLSAFGGLLAIASFAQIGHVTNIDAAIAPLILTIHLAGISLWVGILLPLYRMSAIEAHLADTAKIAHRFGQIAIFFVPILTFAGIGLAYHLLGSFDAIISTNYGRILSLKIILVASLLTLAACNKLKLTPLMQAGNHGAGLHLRKSVGFEIGLIFGILLITAILTSLVGLPEKY